MFENERERNHENAMREHTWVFPYGNAHYWNIALCKKVSSPQARRGREQDKLFVTVYSSLWIGSKSFR